MTASEPLRVAVLISGSGSNLQALIDGTRNGSLPIDILAVVSNEPEALGLGRAARAGIKPLVLNHRDFPSREEYDSALAVLIEGLGPDLLVLAGFMRILTPGFVTRFAGRMLNIHPSLLPRFRGLHTHQRALDSGQTVHGASVHYVTEELDGGPVVLQARVPVEPTDDADALAARVLKREHKIYPLVIRWIAQGRLRLGPDDRPRLDGRALNRPLQLDELTPEQLA